MKPFSQPQQRQHGVVDGCQMSPQVKQSVPARCYFPQDLLGRKASKQLVRPIDLGLPHFQPESYARGVVSHASISCQPLMGVEPLPDIRDGILVERLVQTIRYVADMRRCQHVVHSHPATKARSTTSSACQGLALAAAPRSIAK